MKKKTKEKEKNRGNERKKLDEVIVAWAPFLRILLKLMILKIWWNDHTSSLLEWINSFLIAFLKAVLFKAALFLWHILFNCLGGEVEIDGIAEAGSGPPFWTLLLGLPGRLEHSSQRFIKLWYKWLFCKWKYAFDFDFGIVRTTRHGTWMELLQPCWGDSTTEKRTKTRSENRNQVFTWLCHRSC